jgi:hypothetical protein
MKKRPTIQKFKAGGFLNKTGEVLSNFGKGTADAVLTTIGAPNVIGDEQYYGAGAKGMKIGSKIVGGAGHMALPIVGAAVGGAPGMAVGQAVSNSGRAFNPEEEYNQYSHGGIHSGIPNAEVEKQEVMRMPNGATQQVDGASHENGGIPVNIPNGTQIFSDKLKMPGTKKTFAKLAEKYKVNKEDKTLEDGKASNISKSTAELVKQIKQAKLDEIFATQEQMKQAKLNKYASKLGINSQEFKYGGTKLSKFEDGDWFTQKNQVPTFDPSKGYLGNSQTQNDDGTNSGYNYSTKEGTFKADGTQTKAPYGKSLNPVSGTDIAMAGLNNLGPAFNLLTNKKPKPFEYVTPKLKQYDPTQALQSAGRANALTQRNMRMNSDGNAASYQKNLAMSNAANMMTQADIVNKYDQMNVGAYNQIQPLVADIKNKNIDAMQQDIARYRDINRQAVGNLGTNTTASIKDYKMGKQDQKTLNMVSQMFPNYTYDVVTGQWKHKTTGQILGS